MTSDRYDERCAPAVSGRSADVFLSAVRRRTCASGTVLDTGEYARAAALLSSATNAAGSDGAAKGDS